MQAPFESEVGVVGGGASAVLFVAQLLRRTRKPMHVVIVDHASAFAQGVAYSTRNARHLLNVPAARMSGFPEAPEEFLSWVRKRWPKTQGEDFVPRARFGEYLRATLKSAIAAAPEGSRVSLVADEVIAVVREKNGLRMSLRNGHPVHTRAVALAWGLGSPAHPKALPKQLAQSERYIGWPWRLGALEGLPPDAPVLMLGSGLTMVDVALSLSGQGHLGPWHALSRHGLLPLAHVTSSPETLEWAPSPHASLRRLVREVRSKAVEHARQGGDWRAVVDSLRPLTPQLWTRLTPVERSRFLRHLRAYWDVHRHRLAPEVAQVFERWQAAGRLVVHAGRAQRFRERKGCVEVTWIPRSGAAEQRFEVARVINCSGPAFGVRNGGPLLAQLFRAGLARPDALSIGLDADTQGRVLGPDGAPSPGLLALGGVVRGVAWESVAIPEIGQQAAQSAQAMLGHLEDVPAREPAWGPGAPDPVW